MSGRNRTGHSVKKHAQFFWKGQEVTFELKLNDHQTHNKYRDIPGKAPAYAKA